MLQELVKQALHDRHKSVRQAASEIGIAHTTLNRIIDGQPFDLDTARKICDWLRVDLATILSITVNRSAEFIDRLTICMDFSPSFRNALEVLVSNFEKGKIDATVLDQIANFMQFLMNGKRQNNVPYSPVDQILSE